MAPVSILLCQQTSSVTTTATATSAGKDLSAYVGHYQRDGNPDQVDAVYVRDGALTTDEERLYPDVWTPESTDRFVTHSEGGQAEHLAFHRDAAGQVTGYTITAGTLPEMKYARLSGDGTPLNHGKLYVRSEAMVPVRDGVKLHLVVLRPAGSETSGAPLPMLLDRTPYGARGTNTSVNYDEPELAASGYIFVYADIRGRYGSQGQFVMNRPVVHTMGNHTDPKLVDESSDTYDTVAWMIKNLANNNGRVGVLGVSYPGFLAMMAGVDHHPAVKAISPQAPMTDVWMGDDFFHNGAMRQTYVFDYAIGLESGKTTTFPEASEDAYTYFLSHGNFAGAADAAKISGLPTIRHVIDDPSYTQSWQAMAVEKKLGKPEVPTLETGGYFDQEDMWGTQAEYAALRANEDPNDPKHKVFLALGPWNHGGWEGAGRSLGSLNFGQPTAVEYRKQIEAPFFELYLKDKPGFDLQDTASFRTGVNRWERYDVFPPVRGFTKVNLYMGSDGGLGTMPPAVQTEPVSYVSDPANPIPYRERPIEPTYGKGSRWRPWLASDQKFLKDRTDMARFASPVLAEDTTVTGDVVADLFASTTGTDGDFVVKLIDVYPADAPEGMGGFQSMVVDEIFRGRYRKSFERAEAIPAGKIEEYRWSLHAADHTFLKGHRMLVTVQSTWFPLYDRNPQTFVERIPVAPAQAYRAATISIMTSGQYPSHLEVLRPTVELHGGVPGGGAPAGAGN